MNEMARAFEKVCFEFAVRIVKLSNRLIEKRHEWVLSRQIVRSATSIGANYREAQYAQTKPDFVAKVNIALKESGETGYWLDLLRASGYLPDADYSSLKAECDKITASLVRIVKTAKSNPNR